MRTWNLKPGDPLALSLSADFRLGATQYVNDHTWELEIGGGEPAALSLRTTYGLRARSVRLFPRFTEGGQSISDPAAFSSKPSVQRLYPNFAAVGFSPFPALEVTAEYWVPHSQAVMGRLGITNRSLNARSIQLEWVAQMIPLDGQVFSAIQIQSTTVLAGRTNGLHPVVFITGGPQAPSGPYPALGLGIDLAPGQTRQLTWCQVALNDAMASFDAARKLVARPFDAERARIEMTNASQYVDIHTGDPDWDAALALSQKHAFRLFFTGSAHLPDPSFVTARQPDQGFSQRGDGSDYGHAWSGQSPLEAYYISSLLPGAPQLTAGLVRNFLHVQEPTGFIDCRPGFSGQRGRFMAAPLLAGLAWKAFQASGDREFLLETYPRLQAFFECWFSPEHDRDRNGLPEWAHQSQTGYEENPFFDPWHTWSQGVDITTVQSPALAAMLYREAQALICMAEELGLDNDVMPLRIRAGVLRAGVESCWNDQAALYRYTDRDTHLSPPGRVLFHGHAVAEVTVQETLSPPARLLIRVRTHPGSLHRVEVQVHGHFRGQPCSESLARAAFQWGGDEAVATTQAVYDSLGQFDIRGLDEGDQVTISTIDFSGEDHTLFLPLWARIPDETMAAAMVRRSLFDAARFGRPFGAPGCPAPAMQQAGDVLLRVHLPWNQLIAEGLLAYGLRQEAALLLVRLMNAVIQNLKRARAFHSSHHAEKGIGLGERNALSGLAPVGLFLQVLGVEIIDVHTLKLRGENPFPWPVTVKYRGLSITRRTGQTEVSFPYGRRVTLTDPVNVLLSDA